MEQLVARRAHNPKVTGSSPVPATTKDTGNGILFCFSSMPWRAHIRHRGYSSSPPPIPIGTVGRVFQLLRRILETVFFLINSHEKQIPNSSKINHNVYLNRN